MSTKKLLLIAGAAVGGYFLWTKVLKPSPKPPTASN
jgi:hypothetical protein